MIYVEESLLKKIIHGSMKQQSRGYYGFDMISSDVSVQTRFTSIARVTIRASQNRNGSGKRNISWINIDPASFGIIAVSIIKWSTAQRY